MKRQMFTYLALFLWVSPALAADPAIPRRFSWLAGFALDFAGGQTRVLLDYIGRTTGAARTLTGNWIAQLQVRF